MSSTPLDWLRWPWKANNQQQQGNTGGTDARQRALLGHISSFLTDNTLDITARNLLLAHAAFSGGDARLERRITLRISEGEPITQQWLDEYAPDSQSDDHGKAQRIELDKLTSRLQSGIDSFTATARAARGATGDYQAELARQAGAIALAGVKDGSTSDTSLSSSLDDDPQATAKLLANLAEIASAMLERTRQVEDQMRTSEQEADGLRRRLVQAQHDAEIDHLTGLPNRRAFEGVYNREYREAQAVGEPLSIAFCDIDHFKLVNDRFGHDTGDRVIQALAQVLARISDDQCHVARHGGEEFVMLFRGMNCDQAYVRLDRAREQLSARNFVHRKTDENIGNITFSGGIANVFAYADPRAALEAADAALYLAKNQGRNRIMLAES